MAARTYIGGLAAAMAMIAAAQSVFACGYCVEDKVAATYDYGVLAEAERNGNSIGYAELSGPTSAEPGTAAIVRETVAHAHGVVKNSVRLSAAPPAVSFAWDSARFTLDDISIAVNRELAPRRLRMSVLRQWDSKQGFR